MHLRWSFNRGVLVAALVAQLFAILVYGRFRPQVFLSAEMLLIAPALLLLGGLLAWRPKPWMYVAAAGGVLVLPAILLLVVTHGRIILNPLLPYDFASKVLLLLSAALAVPAGVSGYLRQRRDLPTLTFAQRIRTPPGQAMLVLMGLAVGALASGLGANAYVPEAAAVVFDVAPEATVRSDSRYFKFEPEDLTLRAGVPTEVVAVNHDVAIHTFTYEADGQRYHHELPAGATVRFVVLLDETGTLPYWCELHATPDHQKGMVGTLRLEE